ncbi:hypothetical protein DI487_11290 [Flavobacterium sediminis]|uniref:Uncharacterized protein n=2 Tax=Flavobacteriaceae TaxID=49546 RepID=A0A2U8QWH1_9FLAO|nr:hypothetical protein DI487_11290 [Flavobacterium sediminis]
MSAQVVVSCSDDETDSSETLQEQDVVEIIENSLKEDTGGLSKTIEVTVSLAGEQGVYTETPDINCGETYNHNYSFQNEVNSYSANYQFVSTYQMNCAGNSAPENFSYQFTNTGNYDTPRMTSDDSSNADWNLTGLNTLVDNISLNGSYERNGSQVSKVRYRNSFTSTLTYSISDLQVNKTSYEIQAGTASVHFVGTVSNGNQYTYNGSVTFNGDGTATLVINGNTYIINL